MSSLKLGEASNTVIFTKTPEHCKNAWDSREPTHSELLVEITGDMRGWQSLPRKVIRLLCNQE